MTRAAIAVDLGGTQVRAGLVTDRGELLFHIKQPTRSNDGPDAVLSQIETLVGEVRSTCACADAPIGVSAPGPLDTRTGIVCGLQSMHGFDGFPLRDALQHRLGASILLENDGIAGAIAEWRFGAGQTCADLVYITLSTGIGGGIIAGGRPLRGHRGLAGHVGHIFFTAEGARYPGGAMTCFEDYASATALAHRAKLAAQDAPGSPLAGVERMDAPAVVLAASNGDPTAKSLLDMEAAMVGQGLASLAHVLNPERFILGGGLSSAFDLLAPGIRLAFQTNAKPGFATANILRAGLGEHSCLFGAAALALNPKLVN